MTGQIDPPHMLLGAVAHECAWDRSATTGMEQLGSGQSPLLIFQKDL